MVSGRTQGNSEAVDGPEFGPLLRQHRRASGLSQEELARRAGLSVDAVAALERGRRRAPRPLTARMLADALGLDATDRITFLDTAAGPTDDAVRCVPPPAPTNEMIGRAAEMSDAVLRLTETPTRLLTLTGPGGIGKTRLAAALAQACADRLGATACWVSLEPVVAGSSVASTTAAALGLRPMPGADPLDLIASSIAGRRTLIVLDNCEHVIEESAEMTAALLGRCPELRVLATSRELLGVAGEAVQVVRPLALPPPDTPAERLVGSPAVRLFLARAAARGVNSIDGMPEVAHVVRRLDGMPLAIELAAARLNVLTVRQIARELDESFGILRGGDRSGPARHRTMRAAISWSYDLLEPADQRCLAALSVFVGGWTLDAAEAVCADLGPDEPDVLELVGRLVDRSLIFVRREGAEARYDILSAIRDYALAQLDEQSLADTVSERHARHYAAVLETADSELRTSDQMAWLHLVDEELDNIRSALKWAVEQREADLALRLAGSLWYFCYLRGHYTEGREWLETALELGPADDWEIRAKAILGVGMLAFLQCEYDLATRSIEEALGHYRARPGRLAETAVCLQRLGSIARERADYDRAEELHREAERLRSEIADHSGLAWSRNHLGFIAWLRGDLATAGEECGAALETFRDLGDGEGIAWSLISLGVVSLYRGDLADADDKLCESLRLSQELGYREGIAWSLNQLGVVELRRGHNERAVHLLDESLAEHRDLGDRWRMASVIEALAEVATMRGRAEYATYLVSAAAAVRDAIGAPVPPCEAVELDACVAAIRKTLDRVAFTRAWDAGSQAPLHAVAEGYPVGA